jgi:hypothetical protein
MTSTQHYFWHTWLRINTSLIILLYKSWVSSWGIRHDHSKSQQKLHNLQHSCLQCPSTWDQTFNHTEKYASGKQPEIYFKNSALLYSMHNIQLHSKGVSIWFHPVDNINSSICNTLILVQKFYWGIQDIWHAHGTSSSQYYACMYTHIYMNVYKCETLTL